MSFEELPNLGFNYYYDNDCGDCLGEIRRNQINYERPLIFSEPVYLPVAAPNNIKELKKYIITNLDKVTKDESIETISALMHINTLGLYTFEVQTVASTETSERFFKERCYLNGIFPRLLVGQLVNQLYVSDSNIVVSETILCRDPSKDYLNLYNYSNDPYVPLIDNLYPMKYEFNYYTKSKYWYAGNSGNIKEPMSREYFEKCFCKFSPELINCISPKYSLIQIWSSNIETNILPIVSRALNYII